MIGYTTVGSELPRVGGVEELLLERGPQLAHIAGWLSDASRGRGRLALVLGGAGLGKSTLLDRAAALAGDLDVTTLRARGVELEREMPFGIARQLFETVVLRLSKDQRAVVLGGAAVHARSLTGLAEDVSPVGDLLAVIHGLYWLLANLSQRGPLLLLIDDLHWADAQTARWLVYLSTRIADLPVLVLAAARPAEPGAAEIVDGIADLPDPVTLSLDPLGVGAVGELLRSHFHRAGEEPFVLACLKATGGNPFFLRELLRAATADDLEPSAANAHLVPDLGSKEIARSILVRLARLGSDAKRLAEGAAVLGSDATLRYAAALTGLDRDAALDAWDVLIRGEILRPGQPLDFIHPIARTAIYKEIAPGERTKAHRRAASILHDDRVSDLRVAAHTIVCERAGDQEIVEWLRIAAASALAGGAPDAAASYLQRALAEPPEPDRRPQLQFELGRALIGLDSAQSANCFAQAADGLDPQLRLTALRWHAYSLAFAGCLADAMAAYDRAIEIAGPGTDAGRHLAGSRYFYGAWWADAPDRSQRGRLLREISDGLNGETQGERQLLAASAAAAVFDGSRSAAQLLELTGRLNPHAIGWLDRGGDVTQACVAFVAIICDSDEAFDLLDRGALLECRREGTTMDLSFVLAQIAVANFRNGALLEAEANARTAWEIMRTAGDAALVVYLWSAAALLEILIARGALGEAEALLQESGVASRRSPVVTFPWPEALRGELLLAGGNLADGAKVLLETGAWLEERGFTNPAYIPWRARVAPALAALGRHEEARDVIEPGVQRARRFGAPWALGMALRAAGTVERGDRGIGLLRESVAVLERSPCRLEHAHALLELGAALRRANQRAEAREPLREALDLAHRCGAGLLRGRAEQELAATGARPRRPVLTGIESLTASERRVAQLAAAGASNPDIAQQLFVTRKTVETHLGHVYQKLGITSRQQLQAALAEAPR